MATKLAVQFSDLQTAIRDFLGDAAATVDAEIQRGYRLFLSPPRLGPNEPRHRWSFLSPVSTLALWATTTGTIATVAVVGAVSTLTVATAAFYPSMLYHTIVITGIGSFTITEYVSALSVKVAGDATGAGTKAFSITATGRYSLPETYGSLAGAFVYPEGSGLGQLTVCPAAQIHHLRAQSDYTGQANRIAVVPRATVLSAKDGTTILYEAAQHDTRWDAEVYPKPSTTYEVTYRFRALLYQLDSTTYKWPLGGEIHGELLIQACLAATELKHAGREGDQYRRFMELLSGAIADDREANQSANLGYCWDLSDRRMDIDPRENVDCSYTPRGP